MSRYEDETRVPGQLRREPARITPWLVWLAGCTFAMAACESSQQLGSFTETEAPSPGGAGGKPSGIDVGGAAGSPAGAVDVPSGGRAGAPSAGATQAKLVGCALEGDRAEIVACGLAPDVDIVHVDDTAIVYAGARLARIDRQSGIITTLDDVFAAGVHATRGRYHVVGSEVYRVRPSSGTVEAIDLSSGAHRVIAEGAEGVSLALGPDSLFFRAKGGGGVRRAPLSGGGGASEDVAAGTFAAAPVLVDQGFLYAQEGNRVIRIPLAGGAPEEVHRFGPPESATVSFVPWDVREGTFVWSDPSETWCVNTVRARLLPQADAFEYARFGEAGGCELTSAPPTFVAIADGRLSFPFGDSLYQSVLARPALPTAAALQGVEGTRSHASHAGRVYAAARRAPKHGPTEGVVYRAPLVALPSE